jgi:hypothetical protein
MYTSGSTVNSRSPASNSAPISVGDVNRQNIGKNNNSKPININPYIIPRQNNTTALKDPKFSPLNPTVIPRNNTNITALKDPKYSPLNPTVIPKPSNISTNKTPSYPSPLSPTVIPRPNNISTNKPVNPTFIPRPNNISTNPPNLTQDVLEAMQRQRKIDAANQQNKPKQPSFVPSQITPNLINPQIKPTTFTPPTIDQEAIQRQMKIIRAQQEQNRTGSNVPITSPPKTSPPTTVSPISPADIRLPPRIVTPLVPPKIITPPRIVTPLVPPSITPPTRTQPIYPPSFQPQVEPTFPVYQPQPEPIPQEPTNLPRQPTRTTQTGYTPPKDTTTYVPAKIQLPVSYEDFLKNRQPIITDIRGQSLVIAPLNTDIRYNTEATSEPYKETFDTVPENFDLRTKSNLILKPFDQFLCGSCWAVATANAVSDAFALSGGLTYNPDLSPTFLLGCNIYNQGACAGGNPKVALDYIVKKGLPTKSCVDYNFCATNSDCTSKDSAAHFGSGLSDFLNGLIPKCGCYINEEPHYAYYIKNPIRYTGDPMSVKQHIQKIGPVIAGFHVFENFIKAKGDFSATKDIYIESFNYQIPEQGFNYGADASTMAGSHAVTIIGWGTDTVKDKKVDYWICRNSWGEKWGKDGYFKLAMGTDKPQAGYIYNKNSQTDVDVLVNGAQTGGILAFEPVIFTKDSSNYEFKKIYPDNNQTKLMTPDKKEFYLKDIVPNQLRTENPVPPTPPPSPTPTPTPTPTPVVPELPLCKPQSCKFNKNNLIWIIPLILLCLIAIYFSLKSLKKL